MGARVDALRSWYQAFVRNGRGGEIVVNMESVMHATPNGDEAIILHMINGEEIVVDGSIEDFKAKVLDEVENEI